MAGFDSAQPEDRANAAIHELLDRINVLEQRPFQIPVFDEDPPDTSACNLWMLADGRLRGRNPNGVILEWGLIALGSSKSGTPLPSRGTIREQYVQEWTATSSASYQGGGVQRTSTSHLHYGDSQDGLGLQASLFLFDAADIRATLQGATVQSVELFLDNLHTAYQSGVQITVGGIAPVTTPPTTWPGTIPPYPVVHFERGDAHWVTVDAHFGAAFKYNAITGFGLTVEGGNPAVTGYAAGVGDGEGAAPRVRIRYVK